jgi:RNA 3'-terminal phosphate cyclase (ATP)
MGPQVDVVLEKPGFYPAGGGRFRVAIAPSKTLKPIELRERGPIQSRHAKAVVAGLPKTIAEREIRVIAERLRWDPSSLRTETIRDAQGPGNVVVLEIESQNVTEVFTGFGERGVPAEKVADGVATEAIEYLEAGVPVGAHLADQLLVPCALAGGGAYRTLRPTLHTETQVEVIRTFLGIEIRMEEAGENDWLVAVTGGGGS